MARSRNHYKLPLDLKGITHWHQKVPSSHKKELKHAFDFYVPEGTPIYATLDGIVVWLRKGSRVGGASKKKYWNLGNRIVIKHKNGEYSAYEHLKYKGIVVKVGQKARTGQLIGFSGRTGYTHNIPHLHFEVFTNPDKWQSEGGTLQVNFKIPRKGRCQRAGCYG